jgi:DNA-binding Lrp family transcriptional regulator
MGNLQQVKNKETLLLSHLRNNSREKLTSISKKTGIPIATLFYLLKELEGNRYTKSTILLNFENLGYHSHAQIFLKVNREDKLKVRIFLEKQDSVNTVYKTNNGWDFIIETVHNNIKQLDKFIEKIDENFEIKNHQIHYLIEEVKKEDFMKNKDSFIC